MVSRVSMNPKLFEEIQINAQKLVAKSVSEHEALAGKFKIDAVKQKFLNTGLELLLDVVGRIENKEEISILSFKNILLEVLFNLDFEVGNISGLLRQLNIALVDFIKQYPNYDSNLVRVINTYFEQFIDNVGDYGFYASSSALDILRAQPEYQYSETLYSIVPLETDREKNKIYTLFPKERYWETFKDADDSTSYSPLGYNRFASEIGLPQYQIPISYDSLIVYDNQLYKLKPGINSPERTFFDESQWVKYSPKRFDTSKSFKETYLGKIRTTFGKFTAEGFGINEIISDSKIPKYSERITIEEEVLPFTFGGIGKQVLESVNALKQISEAFGDYEGSPVGGVEYIAKFSEYLLASAYGRNVPVVFEIINNNSIFGKFNLLFASSAPPNRLPGLKFLDKFGRLRSFTHSQTLPVVTSSTSNKIIYNPIYAQFSGGVKDSYEIFSLKNTYAQAANIDLLLYAIEALYKRALFVGDAVKAISNTLNSKGQVPGYEGLGSIEVQIRELQNVFPPSTFIVDINPSEPVGPGFTGAIRYLLNNYSRFSGALINPVFPAKSLEFFVSWIQRVKNKLEEVVNLLNSIGLGTSNYIPNLFFRNLEVKDTKIIGFLRSLGFRDSEINQLFEINNFTELVQKFAPLTDSSDLKSFFRAYELSQLIHEFGGQEAINAYLSFLYSSNSLDSLLNILSLSQKDKSKATYLSLDKYPKLIGLLIGLTYAIDPNQLVKFNNILGKNNLTLLESISFLFQKGESTIIKSSGDVDILTPLAQQMISGVYAQDTLSTPSLNYDQVNTSAPIALKQWTKIIGNNLGKIDSQNIVRHLYNRSSGLTPKELLKILNDPDSPTELGALVDGFSGGAFTSFLRYANISGLAIKLGFYKNSYQTNNFFVENQPDFYVIPTFISGLYSITDSISVIETIFNASLDYTFEQDAEFLTTLQPLVYSQNKEFEALAQVLQLGGAGQTSLPELNQIASSFIIQESPGTGNSRKPNRAPVKNSITPDQATALRASLDITSPLEHSPAQEGALIDKFIKFSSENRFANEVLLTDETLGIQKAASREKTYQPATRYEILSDSSIPIPKSYKVAKLYRLLEENKETTGSSLGTNYISDNESYEGVESFNPVESCKKFGGVNCEELYENSQDRCVNVFNKSLFPETYSEAPGQMESSVPIDRPLGTFADYKPLKSIIPTSAFASPSGFMTLLPPSAFVGSKGEPMLSDLFLEPLVFESGGGAMSEYGNTEFGIIEFIKAKLERQTEFNCAGFESPFYYQICMNVMKCKKFVPPEQGEYFLNFCPKTLSGGRLK
jgi:hypothetical protein